MDSTPRTKPLLPYFLLVILFSLPFWWLGSLPGEPLKQVLRANLPTSALMLVCPLIAASILTYRQSGGKGLRGLFARAFDFHRIRNKIWYLPLLLLLPVIFSLSYALMRLLGRPLPEPRILFLDALIYFLLYFISAICEELGWTGYATDPLQSKWGALNAALFLGVFWAAWHAIPYIQAHNSAGWICWQCLYSVAQRVLMLWIYNNTGQSLFSAVLFHALSNLCWTLFPNYGSHYDPLFTGLLASIAVGVVLMIWEPGTLARKRRGPHPRA